MSWSIGLFFAACTAGLLLAMLTPAGRQGSVLGWLGCLAAIAAALAGLNALLTGQTFVYALWTVPGISTLTMRLDALSAPFVLATGLVLFPASIHAATDSEQRDPPFVVLLFTLYASIVLVLIAGDALLLLGAWELMSVLCFLLIVSGGDRDGLSQVESGYLLLAMGEAGTVAAAIGLLLLGANAPSMTFDDLASAASGLGDGTRWAIFLLTFFGFGVKAGLVPVNSWLPRAYAAAPRQFTPILAGATLNLGVYAILRVNADILMPHDIGTGLLALAIGATSALVGILYATTENDLKTMLAHSSIENTGIAVAALGAGMVFQATHHPALAAIAFLACLYHLVNHSLYKTLLFVATGVVERQTGFRDMDRLGGLIRAMPLTAAAFLIGALSIAGLPPFNGFVSEWLTLQSMLRAAELSSTVTKIVFALAGAALALTAALAVTCFVKAFAMTFLGMRRLEGSRKPREAHRPTLVAMAILALACLLFGALPTAMIGLFDRATSQVAGTAATPTLVPPFFASSPDHDALPSAFVADFHDIGAELGESMLPGRGLVVLHRGGDANPVVFAMSTSYMLLTLALLLGTTWVVVRLWFARQRTVVRKERWDGGLRRLLPEMTYTATGFSNPVRVIFDAIFRPTTVEDTRETVAEHFRNAIRRERARVHLVDRLVLTPVRSTALGVSRTLASMHHGRINAYVMYALLALLIAFAVLPIFGP